MLAMYVCMFVCMYMLILLNLYKLCAVGVKHIISTSEDMEYKQVNHQVLVQRALSRNTFQWMNHYFHWAFPFFIRTGGWT